MTSEDRRQGLQVALFVFSIILGSPTEKQVSPGVLGARPQGPWRQLMFSQDCTMMMFGNISTLCADPALSTLRHQSSPSPSALSPSPFHR